MTLSLTNSCIVFVYRNHNGNPKTTNHFLKVQGMEESEMIWRAAVQEGDHMMMMKTSLQVSIVKVLQQHSG